VFVGSSVARRQSVMHFCVQFTVEVSTLDHL
jgi:hypothetical protein